MINMTLGDCPYCDDFLGLLSIPDEGKLPIYSQINCPSCERLIWYKFSRIDPMAWTIEDFEKEFKIDYDNRKITPL